MRLSASASTIALIVAASSHAAAALDRPKPIFTSHDPRFAFGTQSWVAIPYGGDASATTEENENASLSSAGKNTKAKPASSILDSVSAGGAIHDAAFVGTKTRMPQTRNPYVSGEIHRDESDSPTSLSVATNQKELDTIEETSDEESTESITTVSTPFKAVPKKNGPLKILFLSSDTGGGHRASAEALANQFQRLFPGTTYDLFDIWTDVDSSWPY